MTTTAISTWFPAATTAATSSSPATVTLSPPSALTGISVTLTNVSGGDITAVSVSYSEDGTTYGPTRTLTAGLPLAAGSDLAIDIIGAGLGYKVTITAASAGVATVQVDGEASAAKSPDAVYVAASVDSADGTTGAGGTGASGAGSSHNHAFTGTASAAAEVEAFAGTGFATSGQVVTTTDNQTMTLNQCAGMWLQAATQAPVWIASNTAVTGAPAVLTVYGAAPTTDAGTYKILKAPTPVGTNAAELSHTHTGPSHTHTVSGLS